MPELTSDDDEYKAKSHRETIELKQEYNIPVLDLSLTTVSVSTCDTTSNDNNNNNANVDNQNSTNMEAINDKNNYFQNSQLVIQQVEQYEPSVFCKLACKSNSAYELYDYKLSNNVRI